MKTTDSYAEVNTPDEQFRSHMIIGADGTSGLVAAETRLRSRWNPNQVAYAIEGEVYMGEKRVDDFVQSPRYFDLFFGVSPAGYGWIFPKRDHLTVGVGCRLSDLRSGRGLFEGFVKRLTELADSDLPHPQAHLVPLGGAAKIQTAGNRVLLAGDSGAFVEPLFGEGIYFAVLSGKIAAEAAAEACTLSRFGKEHLRVYEKRCSEEFGVDLDVAYRVACLSYMDQYDMERVRRFFFAERKVQECMVGLMEGSLRYRDVQMKLAWPYFKYRLAKLGLPYYS